MNWLKNQRWIVALMFLILLVVIVAVGFILNNQYRSNIQESVQKELTTIAQLKIDEISDWYLDQIDDAKSISQDEDLVRKVSNWITTRDDSFRILLVNHFRHLSRQHSLSDIILVSQQKELLLALNSGSTKLDTALIMAIDSCLNTKSIQITDLYFCNQHHTIQIGFVAPVKNEEGHLIGCVAFINKADDFLFPYLQKWPVPRKTAETLILEDDGADVLFLNELRHQTGAALNLRIPLTSNEVPAVKVVKGFTGITIGMDYRNVEVISYVSKIPGTPWFLESKIDKQEMYDLPFLNRYLPFIIPAFLILILFFGFLLIFSESQKNSYKKQWESVQAFRTILYSIGDAVITTNRDGLVMNMNQIAEKLTGWNEIEALGQPISKVFNIISEIDRKTVVNPVQKVIDEGVIVNLANHTLLISKDGREIPIADSGAPIHDDQGEVNGVILVFRDQTEEREQHRIMEEQRRQLFTLMSNLPGIAYRCLNDENWTMEFISKGCMELTGYDVEDLINNHKISYSDIIAEEFREVVWDTVQKAIANHENFELEYQIITRKGERKWVWEKGQGVYDENNELVAIEAFISDINKRKKFEFDLKESEQQFQTIAKNSSVGIFKTNADGKTIYVNPMWSKISGVDSSIASGEGWLNSVHPDDREALVADWVMNLKNRTSSEAEYRFIHENGNEVFVKGQAVPEFDEKNELQGYIGTITDVTDIKQAEEKLKSSNLLLSTLINNIPDAIYIKDVEGRKILANKADLINIGVENEEDVIGKTDFEVFPESIARQFWETDLQVMREDRPILYHEEELVNEKNQAKWLSTSKIPYRNAEGKIVGLIGIGHDITQRKKDEEEKSKLLTILTQSPISIVITNLNAEIEYVNPKFSEVSGYSYNEVIGQNPRVLKSGDQSGDFYKEMWSIISKGEEFRGEFHNKKKNGELYWENSIIAPIKNNQGKIINYVAVKEDITDKKILMKELIAAKNKAEESDRLKTSFLANMSHEIRTPLNSILGFTNIITEADDITENERQEYISIISKSSDSLLQIINDIIDISSLETGQLKIGLSTFNVNDLINILYREFVRRFEELKIKDIELKKLNVDAEIQIYTDQNRLNQIIINLLTNATKFTTKGFIEFGIEKFDDQYVYFKVEDTGIGIDEDYHEVIFERFRQAEDNNTRQFGGNGLGLSIVKNLVELMGGKITLESEPGKGSVFRFFLPYRFPESQK